MTPRDRTIKRIFDFLFAFLLIPICIVPILILILFSTIDTFLFGLFVQERIGYRAKKFHIYKIRTLDRHGKASYFGKLLRKTKLDELPQLFNVLIGNMSFVGPRPDLIGFSDDLQGDDRIILSVRPGITGPASLKYRNEESVLSTLENADEYAREVIWPEKVRINKKYVQNYSFAADLRYLFKTVFS